MNDRQKKNKIHGKIIICTFPKPEPDDFSILLKKAGAIVHYMPAIEIRSCSYHLPQDISNYHWVVFTSKNAIRFFAEELEKYAFKKIAVLGEATANELRKFNIEPDFIGTGRSGDDFAEELKRVLEISESVLLVLGKLAPDVIQKRWSNTNKVDRINIYETIAPKAFSPECVKLIESNRYDLLIISSPSAIKNLYLAFHEKKINWRLISMGKTTTAACYNLQITPLATATESTYKGLAAITIEYLQH